jgi:hypothetical protein
MIFIQFFKNYFFYLRDNFDMKYFEMPLYIMKSLKSQQVHLAEYC